MWRKCPGEYCRHIPVYEFGCGHPNLRRMKAGIGWRRNEPTQEENPGKENYVGGSARSGTLGARPAHIGQGWAASGAAQKLNHGQQPGYTGLRGTGPEYTLSPSPLRRAPASHAVFLPAQGVDFIPVLGKSPHLGSPDWSTCHTVEFSVISSGLRLIVLRNEFHLDRVSGAIAIG